MKAGSTNSQKLIYCREIGEIKLVRNPRARKLSIRVKPFDGVIVSIPPRISFTYAEQFVREKQEWIRTSLLKTAIYEEMLTVFDDDTSFATKKHHLYIDKWDRDTLSIRVLNWKIMVKYPKNANVRDEQIQKAIRRAIERALMIEATEFLPLRVLQLAKKLGFSYKSLSIRNSKTRWGSCSRDNRINLNIHLMRLPLHLIDYVIIHELCHTVQKNHGPAFWDLMEKVLPYSKVLNNELKKYQTKVY
jgi:predicted metal-dependent hydrolase